MSGMEKKEATNASSLPAEALPSSSLAAAAGSNNSNNSNNNSTRGKSTVIGIDLGNCNCAAAVWDATRGHAKWMRLQGVATQCQDDKKKVGRVVPSVVLFATRDAADKIIKHGAAVAQGKHRRQEPLAVYQQAVDDDTLLLLQGQQQLASVNDIVAWTGAAAVELVDQVMEGNPLDDFTPAQVSAATVSSVKRVFGMTVADMRAAEQADATWMSSLPFAMELSPVESSPSSKEEELLQPVTIRVQPLGASAPLLVSPTQVAALLLRSIRLASEEYLQRNMQKKSLQVPGNTWQVKRGVIGVPAQFGQGARQAVIKAAKWAGFDNDGVTVLTESTAAAMAYGIFVGSTRPTEKTSVLVLDMGGGTTDVTIAEMDSNDGTCKKLTTEEPHPNFEVRVTAGDAHLGGDDMDNALLTMVAEELEQLSLGAVRLPLGGSSQKQPSTMLRTLLHQCRRAKERLCGDVDHGLTKPEDSVTIIYQGLRVNVTQEDFRKVTQPLIERLDRLITLALDRYATVLSKGNTQVTPSEPPKIHEVILVGGATRVPAVRDLLRQRFPPPPDLCLSINALAAVAQGTAVKAAMQSGDVALHELRSAMMLDTTPHAMGVLLGPPDHDSEEQPLFVELVPRNSPLPASGWATFTMASLRQPGVSLTAVEQVEDSQNGGFIYPKMGQFTFLLHRLTASQIENLVDGVRSVDVRMTLNEDGALIVSVYDPNDPEHVHKKDAFHNSNAKAKSFDAAPKPNVLQYDVGDSDGFPREQILLIILLSVLMALYVAAKLVFHDELEAMNPTQ